jgi:2-methylisocitrate lyase-like PEP mutase family enzyme
VSAAELRALHEAPELLVMVNVWDAVSASVAGALPGVRALATTSHAIAGAHGHPDGEVIPRAEMIDAIALICRHATDVPVSADLEGGYGGSPAEVAETVRLAVAAGAVGANIVDRLMSGGLRSREDAVARIAAARDADPDLVINARTDEFLFGGNGDLDEAVVRGRGFLDAGADCVFVPGLADRSQIAALGEAFDGRLSILVGAESPMPDLPGVDVARLTADLPSLGVARVSFGPFGQRHAMFALAGYVGGLLATLAPGDD